MLYRFYPVGITHLFPLGYDGLRRRPVFQDEYSQGDAEHLQGFASPCSLAQQPSAIILASPTYNSNPPLLVLFTKLRQFTVTKLPFVGIIIMVWLSRGASLIIEQGTVL